MVVVRSLTTQPNTPLTATPEPHSSTAFQRPSQSPSPTSRVQLHINSASHKPPPKAQVPTRQRSPTSFPQSHPPHQPTSLSHQKPRTLSPSHGPHPTTADNPSPTTPFKHQPTAPPGQPSTTEHPRTPPQPSPDSPAAPVTTSAYAPSTPKEPAHGIHRLSAWTLGNPTLAGSSPQALVDVPA